MEGERGGESGEGRGASLAGSAEGQSFDQSATPPPSGPAPGADGRKNSEGEAVEGGRGGRGRPWRKRRRKARLLATLANTSSIVSSNKATVHASSQRYCTVTAVSWHDGNCSS